MRMFRLLLASGLVLAMAGAAWAGGGACQAGKASTDKASTKNAGACASSAACTPAQQAACAAHADMAGCSYCGFKKELGASNGKVNFTAVDTRDGVIVTFAAADRQDVGIAQALAAKAYAMMSAPTTQCAVTKAKMAEKSCPGCKPGLEAFTNAEVKMENTEEGARAVVVSTDPNSVAKLHAFFHTLQGSEKAPAKG